MCRPFGSLAPSGARHVGYYPPNGLITLACIRRNRPRRHPQQTAPERAARVRSTLQRGESPARRRRAAPVVDPLTDHYGDYTVRVVCRAIPNGRIRGRPRWAPSGRGRPSDRDHAGDGPRAPASESSRRSARGSSRSAQPGPATSEPEPRPGPRQRVATPRHRPPRPAAPTARRPRARCAGWRRPGPRPAGSAPSGRQGTPRSARAAASTTSGSTCCSPGIPASSTGRASGSVRAPRRTARTPRSRTR